MDEPKTPPRGVIDEDEGIVAPGEDGKAVSDTEIIDDTTENERERDDDAPLSEKEPNTQR
jgi:hypothetical protein